MLSPGVCGASLGSGALFRGFQTPQKHLRIHHRSTIKSTSISTRICAPTDGHTLAHDFAMKELALQAGVSLATVDRVVHQRPGVRAATPRRVQQAWAELERQQQQVRLRGQRLLIDLVMEAPTRLSRILRGALDEAMRRTQPAVCRARDHLAETRSAEQWVAVLDGIARRGSHGVLLKAPDLPVVADAVARLQARRIPVVTLVTDMPSAPRLSYVGLDNRCAGQTAAYLMDRWLGAHCCDVLVSSSGQRFQGEGERIEAFRVALAAARSPSRAHPLDAGRAPPPPAGGGARGGGPGGRACTRPR